MHLRQRGREAAWRWQGWEGAAQESQARTAEVPGAIGKLHLDCGGARGHGEATPALRRCPGPQGSYTWTVEVPGATGKLHLDSGGAQGRGEAWPAQRRCLGPQGSQT